MENINMENTARYAEQIKERFALLSSDGSYNSWAETFEITQIDKKQVTVVYFGTEDAKVFNKTCRKTLQYCIRSVVGNGAKINILYSSKRSAGKPGKDRNIRAFKFFVIGMIFVCIAAAMIAVLCSYIGNRNFKENFYSTSSIKIDSGVRVIQISDLHGVSYGANNKKLLERIGALAPDIIICTGDIVDSTERDVEYVLSLARGLAQIAPTYYVYGNNETESIYDFALNEKELDKKFGFNQNNRDGGALLKLSDAFEAKLEAAGIKVLKNEKDTVKVRTMNVDVYGVLTSNPSSFWSYAGESFGDYLYSNPENLKITAVHEPVIFEEFQPEFWGDLLLSGHTHGGVVRVPVLGPLYVPNGGLFPERSGHYVYGRYEVAGRPLIVSAGLENKNVFRINNEPELVVIDINKF